MHRVTCRPVATAAATAEAVMSVNNNSLHHSEIIALCCLWLYAAATLERVDYSKIGDQSFIRLEPVLIYGEWEICTDSESAPKSVHSLILTTDFQGITDFFVIFRYTAQSSAFWRCHFGTTV